ncbi:MAG: hypothetical protein KDD62_06990, partial [Bdellovibrionales bacterium]|nr:hypothetical protein [Bdellovibrionales bacterium]
SDEEIRISLHGKDVNYKHRGLKPYVFHVASDKGTSLNSQLPIPKSVLVNGVPVGLNGLPVYQLAETVDIDLTFDSERTADQVVQLQDVYLWYFNQQLFHLDFNQAQVVKKEGP